MRVGLCACRQAMYACVSVCARVCLLAVCVYVYVRTCMFVCVRAWFCVCTTNILFRDNIYHWFMESSLWNFIISLPGTYSSVLGPDDIYIYFLGLLGCLVCSDATESAENLVESIRKYTYGCVIHPVWPAAKVEFDSHLSSQDLLRHKHVTHTCSSATCQCPHLGDVTDKCRCVMESVTGHKLALLGMPLVEFKYTGGCRAGYVARFYEAALSSDWYRSHFEPQWMRHRAKWYSLAPFSLRQHLHVTSATQDEVDTERRKLSRLFFQSVETIKQWTTVVRIPNATLPPTIVPLVYHWPVGHSVAAPLPFTERFLCFINFGRTLHVVFVGQEVLHAEVAALRILRKALKHEQPWKPTPKTRGIPALNRLMPLVVG